MRVKTTEPRASRVFHLQAVFGTAFTFLTGGVFLSGFAIFMGASDLLVSYISMITNICGVCVIFFSSIVGRFASFRKVAIALTVMSRLATLLIVSIPFVVPRGAQIGVFIPLVLVAFTLQAQTTVVINNWLVTFVDNKQSGKYIARRQTFVLAVTVTLSLAGGQVLDAVSGAYIGFVILFMAAAVMAAAEVAVLLRIPDAVQPQPSRERHKPLDLLLVPIRHRPFLGFVIYIFLFYLLLSFADSFTVVYMMRYLELSYTATTAMQMLLSLPQIFLLGVWGRLADSKGHRFTLTASIWFFAGETFFFALSNPHNLYICLPIAFLLASVANAGFAVSVFNRRYELIPQEGRIICDNFYSAGVGLAVILGPLIGGAVKQHLETVPQLDSFLQFGNIRLLYVISTVAMVLLQVILIMRRARGR